MKDQINNCEIILGMVLPRSNKEVVKNLSRNDKEIIKD